MTPREILERLIEIFTEKVTAGRLLALFFLLALLGGVVGVYESYTGAFRLSRLSRATELIAKLDELRKGMPQGADDELTKAHAQISRELLDFVTPTVIGFHLDKGFAKVGATFAVWCLICVSLALIKPRSPVRGTVVGIITLSFPFCVIAALLPDFPRFWMDLVFYPIGHVLLLGISTVLIAGYLGKKLPNLMIPANADREPPQDAESGARHG